MYFVTTCTCILWSIFLFQQTTCSTSKSDNNIRNVSGECPLKKNKTVNNYECNSNEDGRYDSTATRVPSHSSDFADGRESHARFRHGLLQLMIHTIDPLHDSQSSAGICKTNHFLCY